MSTYFWGLLALIALAVTSAAVVDRNFLRAAVGGGTQAAVQRGNRGCAASHQEVAQTRNHDARRVRVRAAYCRHPRQSHGLLHPLTLFAMSTYYIFACLEYLQGATPSERHFIGVIPMITSQTSPSNFCAPGDSRVVCEPHT